MDKIYILASPFCLWNEHLTFEAWVVELLSEFKNSKIIFVGERHHVWKLKMLVPHLSIIYISQSFQSRFLLGFYVIFSVFFLHIFGKNKVLFLSFEHPHIVFLIGMLFRNSIWFLHTYWSRNKIINFIKKIWYKFFILRNKSIVLWDWIYKNMPFYKNNFFIHHPIPSFLSNLHAEKKKNQVVIFPSHKHRFIGWEGITYLIKQQLEDQGVQVLESGWSERKLDIYDYYYQLATSQFCVFLSSKNDYDLRCSWSLFDALGLWIFVYGIESEMSRSILHDFWNIGFFGSSIEDIYYALDRDVPLEATKQIDFPKLILERNIPLIAKILH